MKVTHGLWSVRLSLHCLEILFSLITKFTQVCAHSNRQWVVCRKIGVKSHHFFYKEIIGRNKRYLCYQYLLKPIEWYSSSYENLLKFFFANKQCVTFMNRCQCFGNLFHHILNLVECPEKFFVHISFHFSNKLNSSCLSYKNAKI